MENIGMSNNINEKNKSLERKHIDKKIESSNITERKFEECIINISQIENIEPKDENIFKSFCKVEVENKAKTTIGLGFLLQFIIGQESFYFLISYEHVIKDDIINNNNNIISMYFNNELKSSNIKSDLNQRFIKSFINIGLDITVIEILDKDNIPKDYFIYNEFEVDNNRLINSKIFIPKLDEEKMLKKLKGEIIKINKYEFIYSNDEDNDSTGNPIFLEKSNNILGIPKRRNKNINEYYGYLIYPIINIIEKDKNKRSNNGKYINGKYIWEDGKYYIGEYKDNIPNGKGKKYYSNGNILYEGDFINGKFEGNGKYYCNNGYYFIGEYKDGLRNGKGIKYHNNGNIYFEGDYINDKADGYGKCFWDDGEYYLGQFKNGSIEGKGTIYYKNGKIKYDGDWINNRLDGYGKYVIENGEYYIGQWKKNFRHGKGILYHSNGNIEYEGDWINDEKEGKGKSILLSGEYYIGQWKNSEQNGKGINYYANGNIKYKGDFAKGKPNGIGYYIYEDGDYYIGQFKNGLKHGKGTLYNPNGKIEQEGNWSSNIFLGNLEI